MCVCERERGGGGGWRLKGIISITVWRTCVSCELTEAVKVFLDAFQDGLSSSLLGKIVPETERNTSD